MVALQKGMYLEDEQSPSKPGPIWVEYGGVQFERGPDGGLTGWRRVSDPEPGTLEYHLEYRDPNHPDGVSCRPRSDRLAFVGTGSKGVGLIVTLSNDDEGKSTLKKVGEYTFATKQPKT